MTANTYSGLLAVNESKVLGKCPQCSFDAKALPQSIEIVGNGKYIGYRVVKPKSSDEPTMWAVMLGTNIFISAEGILSNEVDGKRKEFFRVREQYRARSEGSYLTVDVDIKDKEGKREVKLAKSRPVVQGEGIAATVDKKRTTVKREDGSIVFEVQQLETYELPYGQELKRLWEGRADLVLKISGNFVANDCVINIGPKEVSIIRYAEDGSIMNDITLEANMFIGTSIILDGDKLKIGR
ncbi:MAG: hypothetical protein ACRYFR_05005 [Janthinobacterium lividum]